MTPQDYCRQKLIESKSSFRHAFRGLPTQQRLALEALYAYCREVDDAVDEPSDGTVAATRLTWWGDETQRMLDGAARHPVTKALHAARQNIHLPGREFLWMLEGMKSDLAPTIPDSWAALETYADQVAGTVGRLSARIFSQDADEATLRYATHWGLALQLTNIVRDVGEDFRRGRIYIPADLLASHGATAHQITQPAAQAAIAACLHDLGSRAKSHYQLALEALPKSQRWAQRPGLGMGVIYRDLLDVLLEDPLLVLSHRISLGTGRKLLLASLARLGLLPRFPTRGLVGVAPQR